jgi:hypothetical protein
MRSIWTDPVNHPAITGQILTQVKCVHLERAALRRAKRSLDMRHLAKITAVASMLAMASVAFADLNRVGPVNNPSPPGNGFPLWYQDLNGMVLDMCIPTTNITSDPQGLQTLACLLGPPAPPQPWTFPTTYPGELFYYRLVSAPMSTDHALSPNQGKKANFVAALEASFLSGTATPGQQMVFARIRVTAGVPFNGDYIVHHPYGDESFPNVVSDPVGTRDIVFTEDVGLTPGNFSDALVSRVGPFLQHSDLTPGGPPAGSLTLPFAPVVSASAQFLGDGVLARFITGSPFNQNYFEICGPLPTTNPNYQCYHQDLFTITGRIHDANAPVGSPLSVSRATFARDGATSQVDVMARVSQGPGVAAPKLSAGGANIPPVLLAGPTVLGDWYAQGIPVPSGNVPGTVTVTNSGDPVPTSITTKIVDEVSIRSVAYSDGTLTVVATSSDRGAAPTATSAAIPPATLSLAGFPTATATHTNAATDPAEVTFTATVPVVGGKPVPPAFARVSSSSGGQATADTNMGVAVPPSAPGVPYAADDSTSVVQSATQTINIDVLANDLAGALPFTAGSVAILPPGPNIGVASVVADQIVYRAPSTVGTATFQYTVSNAAGRSNVGTVTVVVTPSPLAIPTAVADPPLGQALNVVSGQALVVNVLANDIGNGGVLNPASVLITTAPAAGRGTATVLADGTVRFVGGATLGTATFAYTVANTNGQVSAPATVTVNVTAAEALTIKSPAKCALPNKWQLQGTSNISAGNTVTIYAGAVAPGATVVGTAPVINGAWQFQGLVTCVNTISIQSTIGTKFQNVAVQVK